MPSYYRDLNAPTPNVPRRIGVTALIEHDGAILVERRAGDADEWAFFGGFRVTPRGDAEPALSEESAGMRFASREELARLPFWPVHRPIRDALLAEPAGVVLE